MKDHKLTPAQVHQFKQDGFLTGLRAVDAETSRRHQALYNELEKTEGREKCQIGLIDRHFDLPFVWEIASNPVILDSIESLIGSDFMLMSTHFFCKYGPTEKFVAWHQDVTYWGIEPEIAISAWYAVDDVDAGNGVMQAIPGSHRAGIVEHGTAGSAGNLLSVNQEVSVTKEEAAKAVDLTLKAGEFSLHDGLTLHGSQPNRSTRRRCGVTNVYIPSYVKQVRKHSSGEYWSGVMMRGLNRSPSFKEKPKPFPMAS
jgi:non-haem Fe2+, alpha-ketoglutarate-dependent halogenase